ncbi:MAG: hypothetical protein ACMUIP_08950 [bacterium]
MYQYEYDITMYPASEFKKFAFFCSEKGECNLDELEVDKNYILGDLLNERGKERWELVQLVFGKDVLACFWKRIIMNTPDFAERS